MRGRARALGGATCVVRSVEARVRGGAARRQIEGGIFELVGEDGAVVRVEAGGAELLVTVASAKLPWSEARAGGAAGFPEDFAAPFDEVELDVAEIADGAVVEIAGVATEHGFDDAGYREAARPVLRAVRARLVAAGAGAGRRLDEALAREQATRERRGRRARADARRPEREDPGHPAWRPALPWWGFSVGVAAIAAVVLAAGSGRMHHAYAVLLGAYAVHVIPRRPLPTFSSKATPYRDWPDLYLVGTIAAPIVAFAGIQLVQYPRALIINCFAVVVLLAVTTLLGRFTTYRRLSALLAAPRRPELVPGSWAAVGGVVADATPAQTDAGEVAVAAVLEVPEHAKGSDLLEGRRFVAKGGFQIVQDGDGVVIGVAPADVVWASTVTSTRKDGGAVMVMDSIPVGGRVWAAGRIERAGDELRLRSAGARPALVLSTSAAGDPRATARRLLWSRRVTLAAHVAAAVAMAWAVGWI